MRKGTFFCLKSGQDLENRQAPPNKNSQEYPPGNTLFLFNIIRMPYFVASDELTLATFMFEPETFLPLLVVRNAVRSPEAVYM